MAERKKQKHPKYIWIAAVLAVLAAALVLLGKAGSHKADLEAAAVAEGRAFLSELEAKDPGDVRAVREEIYFRRMQEQKDALTESIMSGETDPFPLFQDYAILGDSRAVGFWYHDFLDSDRVLADGGNTIRAIPDRLGQLQELNPKYVFLCYGLNDTSIGYWDTAEAYAAEYMQHIASIQAILPEAKIVVSSILPARDPAFNRSGRWHWIPDWNVVLEATCAENGVLYANCNWLYDSFPGSWDPDGIHFRPSLYPYWGGMLLVTALYGGLTYEG